jgi:hypothetical protein
MHQLGPNRWVFEPPDVAPMKASCARCRQTVAMLRPQAAARPSGDYVILGKCEKCRGEIVLIFEGGG